MVDNSAEVLKTLQKIEQLLELLAEDKIAERDAKQRKTLIEIVGASPLMRKSVLLMDGVRTQKEICTQTSADSSNFSKLIAKLNSAKLLVGDTKAPKLVISVPAKLFEKNE